MMNDPSLFGEFGPLLSAGALLFGGIIGVIFPWFTRKAQTRNARLLESYDSYIAALQDLTHAANRLRREPGDKEAAHQWNRCGADVSIARTRMEIRGAPERILVAGREMEASLENKDLDSADTKTFKEAQRNIFDASKKLVQMMRESL